MRPGKYKPMVMLQSLFTFIVGGLVYFLLELAWRGRSHRSMFITAGLCCMLRSALFLRYAPAWPLRLLLAGLVITAAEFLCGVAVNRRLGVWDYSARPRNLYGQVCLDFSLLWSLMALPISALGAYAAYLVNLVSPY